MRERMRRVRERLAGPAVQGSTAPMFYVVQSAVVAGQSTLVGGQGYPHIELRMHGKAWAKPEQTR